MWRKEPIADASDASPLLRYGVLEVDFERLRVAVDGCPVALEGVLLKILIVLARHPQHVLTRARLLADVWGTGSGRQEKTVDVAICRLKGRLGPAADYISSVRSFGYRFGPPG